MIDVRPQSAPLAPFPCARFIKEIGRGLHGARALAPEDTFALYQAMLDRRVSDVELGAVLIRLPSQGRDGRGAGHDAGGHAGLVRADRERAGYLLASLDPEL